jgi:two-component system phosphate regulon sensor histidine kinase PhoR
MIIQVFSNLIDNAVKFTPEKGKITVKAREEDDFIQIDVSDTGIGIEEEHLPRIFERFYRVDKARSREMGGTGLGLAIVKHIVHANKGKVSVKSEPGKGSTFSVFLPKATS